VNVTRAIGKDPANRDFYDCFSTHEISYIGWVKKDLSRPMYANPVGLVGLSDEQQGHLVGFIDVAE
jgi:hypothetical protein